MLAATQQVCIVFLLGVPQNHIKIHAVAHFILLKLCTREVLTKKVEVDKKSGVCKQSE